MIVVRAVAWAEISTPITSIRLWDAAQVGAHADHNEPLGLLAPLCVGGGVTHRWCNGIVLACRLDHFWGALPNKDGLATPLHNEILAIAHWPEVNLDDSCSPDILCRPHRVDQLASYSSHKRGHDEAC